MAVAEDVVNCLLMTGCPTGLLHNSRVSVSRDRTQLVVEPSGT